MTSLESPDAAIPEDKEKFKTSTSRRGHRLYGSKASNDGAFQCNPRFTQWLNSLPSPNQGEDKEGFVPPYVGHVHSPGGHSIAAPTHEESEAVAPAQVRGHDVFHLPYQGQQHTKATDDYRFSLHGLSSELPQWPLPSTIQAPKPRQSVLFDAPGNANPSKKHERTSDESVVLEPNPKRARGRLGYIKNRLSRGFATNTQLDRPKSAASSIFNRLGHRGKHLLGRLTPANHHDRAVALPMFVGQDAPIQIPAKPHHNIRFAFVGDHQAGKTSLLLRFTKGQFFESYNPTVFAMEAANVQVDDFKATVELWDIPANIETKQANPLGMTYFEVACICFSIDDENNLASVINKWETEVRNYCEGVPVILVSLKKDLRPNSPTLRLRFLNEPTPSSIGQGEVTASDINASAYFECSAKTGDGVNDFFEKAVRFAVQSKLRREQKLARIRKDNARGKRLSNMLCFLE